VIFPGRFEEEKWRPVLEAMVAVAASLKRLSKRHREHEVLATKVTKKHKEESSLCDLGVLCG
jgi:hypothetical protein